MRLPTVRDDSVGTGLRVPSLLITIILVESWPHS